MARKLRELIQLVRVVDVKVQSCGQSVRSEANFKGSKWPNAGLLGTTSKK